MWEANPKQQFLALPIPNQVPKTLEHLEIAEWEALSWSLDQLQEQQEQSQIH
jgi:hypothetical protein